MGAVTIKGKHGTLYTVVDVELKSHEGWSYNYARRVRAGKAYVPIIT